MSEESIEQRTIFIVSQAMGDPVEMISRETTFESLGVDSIDMVEMLMEAEDEFEFGIPDTDVENFQTVGQAIDYIKAKVGQP